MTQVDTQALLRAVAFLTEQLEEAVLAGEGAKAESLEKIAKSISAHIKTLREVDAYNDAVQTRDDNQRYLSYEDYPPLRPSDRAEILRELDALFTRITADEGADCGSEGL